MSQIFAYLRTSTDKQDPNGQRLQILDCARTHQKDRERIVELLGLGVSIRHISKHHLDYGSPSSLHYYVTTRELQGE